MESHPPAEVLSILNIAVDVLLICISLLSSPVMETIKPNFEGFFCNDNTIRYPYKTSTVNDSYLYGLSSAIPVLAITCLELWTANGDEQLRRRRVLVNGRAIPAWIVRWVRTVLLYGYGLGCQEVLANVGKLTVGRLRPHFLAVCNPDVQCNVTDPHAYIIDYRCATEGGSAAVQSRLSFPSGHSAMSFYAAIFFLLYTEKRVRWPNCLIVVKTAVQTGVVGLAWFTALSRISDHKHHWGDVATGCLIGALVAWFWVYRVLRVQTEPIEMRIRKISTELTYIFPNENQQEKS